jgi:GTPase
MPFHSGFVCILGRPNAGKSTLLNALVGEKIAIISPKPQTTRNRIQGILNIPARKNKPGAQVVLIDTPGVHRPDSSLGRKMMTEVREALEGCDLILVIVDATEKRETHERKHEREDRKRERDERTDTKHQKQERDERKHDSKDTFVLEMAKRAGTPVFLLLNKIDRVEKARLLPLIENYRKLHEFREIIPISALKRSGLDVLLERVVANLPAGPRYFPEDQVTDQPARFMVSEIIREQVLHDTKEEVPHSTTVAIENYEEGAKLTRIAAVIYCERESQKGILVGKGGQMLKKIGTAARLNIEKMLGTRVFLELFVKARPGWRDSREFVDELDWRRQLEHLIKPEKIPPEEP